jgi:uncharacterized protein (TIGR03000 family)
MRTLLFCAAVAFLGLGITEQAHAQKSGSRGSGRGYSNSQGYYGGGYGGNYNRGYGYGLGLGLYGGYGGYSYGYPYNGYDNSYYGNDYRNSYYPPTYSGDISPATYQPQQPSSQTVIRVMVPNPDAVVLFDGAKTSSLGRERTFLPPQLQPGYSYSYQVTASWTQDGRTVKESRTVQVVPGQPSVVDFTRAAPAELVAPPAKTKTPQS